MAVGDRYEVVGTRDPVFDHDAYELRDRAGGSSALVIPALGNNLTSFVACLEDGRCLETILAAPLGESPARASKWGNPILFPFPNRVRDARYRFQGQAYQLAVNTPEGHHIHGLVADLAWRLEEATAGDQGAVIRSSISAEDHPSIMSQYPFPFRLVMTYTLSDNTLRCDAEVRNTGSGSMPVGFGLHPYFRVPLGEDGMRGECLIHVPARFVWELDAEKLPTGRQDLVPPELDFSMPRPLDGIHLDHSYTGLANEGGQTVCRLRDPQARVEVAVRFGKEFPELVVLAPDDRSTVSFEPYSCVTDAVNLASWLTGTGLVVLEPGHSWQGTVWFEVTTFATE